MPDQKKLADIFNAIAPPREHQRYSVGHCCQLMGITPTQLEILMRHSEVKFSYLVDSVLFVDGHDLQKIVDAFNEITIEIANAKETIEAAPSN